MAKDIDEVLSVKLCCAGVIICNVVMIICLLTHFIQTSSANDDITNFRHFISYSISCVAVIICIYLIERGRLIFWIICVLINVISLVLGIFDFEMNAYMLIGLIMIVISLILLLTPPVCRKCNVPVLRDLPWFES